MFYSTLVIILSFSGPGFHPDRIHAEAVPAAQCEALRAHLQTPPKDWSLTSFCTPGGDPRLNK